MSHVYFISRHSFEMINSIDVLMK